MSLLWREPSSPAERAASVARRKRWFRIFRAAGARRHHANDRCVERHLQCHRWTSPPITTRSSAWSEMDTMAPKGVKS
jgi:hypothetical protein